MRDRKAHVAGRVVAVLSTEKKVLYGTLDAKSAPALFRDHHTEMAAFVIDDEHSLDLMKKNPDVKCWTVGCWGRVSGCVSAYVREWSEWVSTWVGRDQWE